MCAFLNWRNLDISKVVEPKTCLESGPLFNVS